MTNSERVFIAGHSGMAGSAIRRSLIRSGLNEQQILVCERKALDLTSQSDVLHFLKEHRPTQVYLAAAKVGGIHANNTYPADFLYQNLMIQANVINAAFSIGVKRLLFLGSSCIYPRLAAQPMQEEALLSGYLEPTNEPYAVAKIAGIKLCESYNRQYQQSHGISYRSIMPTNLYGPGDNYHPENSHVIPALIRRFHQAKVESQSQVTIWGSGKPRREFLYVDDMARACVALMSLGNEQWQRETEPQRSHLNAGFGSDVSILELAHAVANTVGFTGEIKTDTSKPDGPPQKLMDSSRLNQLGWTPEVSLEAGLKLAYSDFLSQLEAGRLRAA